MSKEVDIKDLAAFRAKLLAMLTEGIEISGENSAEEIASKIEWFFKMNDTKNITCAYVVTVERNHALLFENLQQVVLIAKVEKNQLTFLTTQEMKTIASNAETDGLDKDGTQNMIDMGVTMLYLVHALHTNNIVYNLKTQVSSHDLKDDDINEDDWAI